MKKLSVICSIAALLLATQALAGNLTINGNLTVTTNLTAGSISLGGVTQTNWPGALAFGYQGAKYVIVAEGSNDVQRGSNLQAAYTTATTLNPTTTNRVVVLVPPGDYNTDLTMTTSYVDLIGLVPAQMTTKQMVTNSFGTYLKTVPNIQCPVNIEGTIVQNVDNVRIESVIIGGYDTSSGEGNSVLRHVAAGWMQIDVPFDGLYIDCVAGDGCFGYGDSWSPTTDASGTFIDCVAGENSFGGDADDGQGDGAGSGGGVANGVSIGCTAGDYSFGTGHGNSGVFVDCVSGNESFAGEGATMYGTLINCVGGNDCFGGDSGTIANTAKFQHCRGGNGSFGSFSMASADFNYNVGGANTFVMYPNLPTSTNGLPSGTVYNSSGTLKVMP